VSIESSDGEHIWNTVGVSENIIEACLKALIDSVDYMLTKYVPPHEIYQAFDFSGSGQPVSSLNVRGGK
jgi:2-isopropylmalate synthase